MRKHNLTIVIHLLVLTYFFMNLTFVFGCSNQDNKSVSTAHLEENKSTSHNVKMLYHHYSPLTYEIFNSIRDDSMHFSSFIFHYGTFTNVYDKLRFSIGYGNLSGDFALSSVEEFDGSLYQLIEMNGEFDGNSYEHIFSDVELNSIFDYISLPGNRTYFFNGDEYEGLDIPYRHPSICPPHKKYNFSLIFSESEIWPDAYGWAIFKCVDEYPSPDSPLYGLFQLLEDDFISQFE